MVVAVLAGCVAILVFVVIASVAVSSRGTARSSTQLKSMLPGVEHFFVSPWDRSVVGISFGQRKAVFGRREQLQTVAFEDLLEIELISDRGIVSSMSKASLAKRAVVGGVLLGGAGALVGAISAKRNSTTVATRLALRVVTSPGIFMVTFFDVRNTKTRIEGALLSSLEADADRYYGHLIRALRESQREPISST